MKDLYTIEEAAEKIGIKESTLRNWLSDGKIKGVKIGYATFIKKDLAEMLKTEQNKTKKSKQEKDFYKKVRGKFLSKTKKNLDNTLYTIEEASKKLNIKETTLRNLIYNGKIKGEKHGYARFISKEEVEEILKSKEEKQC